MKEITLNNNELKVLKVNIGKESYNVPLLGSLSTKEARAFTTGDTADGFEFFGKYIPQEVLDSMTMDDFQALSEAWKEASADKTDVTPGESSASRNS